MIIETKTNASYNKLEYKHIGKVGNEVIEVDDIINWLESKGYKAGVSRYSRYLEYIDSCQLKTPTDENERKRIILPAELEEMYKKG